MLIRPLVSGVPSWQRGRSGSVAQGGMPAVQSICRGSSVPMEKIRKYPSGVGPTAVGLWWNVGST